LISATALFECGIVQGVGDGPQAVEAAKEQQVPALEIFSNRFRQLPASAAVRRLQRAKGVDDDCDVNCFLKNCCRYRRQPSHCGCGHG
jgi:hypothetical protein